MEKNTVKVIDNFLEDESSIDAMMNLLDKRLKPSPRFGIYTGLGWKDSETASKAGIEIDIFEGYEVSESAAVKLIGDLIVKVGEAIEKEFGEPAGLVNGNYQKMITGSSNGMHSDTTDLKGGPLQPDGEPEEMVWSGLFYFNTCNEDFFGGEIHFPKQQLTVAPERNQLVIFVGDFDHIHEVLPVTSGERKNFCFFYGKKGNTSSGKSFFTVQDDGYEDPGSWHLSQETD